MALGTLAVLGAAVNDSGLEITAFAIYLAAPLLVPLLDLTRPRPRHPHPRHARSAGWAQVGRDHARVLGGLRRGMLTVAALGPSAAVPTIPGSAGWPPYSLDAHPPAGLVYSIQMVAVLAGAIAAWRLMTAARQDRCWIRGGCTPPASWSPAC